MKRVSLIMMTAVFTAFFAFQGFTQNAVSEKNQADNQKNQPQKSVSSGNFIDKNNNGICDNFEARGNNAHGRNFVDKNGDGKCDNCQSTCKGKGNGNGYGKGNENCKGSMGSGKGCCGKGNGQGYQHRHGCANMNQEPAKSTPDTQEKK